MRDDEIAHSKTELQVPSVDTQRRSSEESIRAYAHEMLWRFEKVKQAFATVMREAPSFTPELHKMHAEIDFADLAGQSLSKSLARTHTLKTDAGPLADVISGKKKFELRVFDRDFRVGDFLQLCEFDRTTRKYSGTKVLVRVTYILQPGLYGLTDNLGVMGIELIDASVAEP